MDVNRNVDRAVTKREFAYSQIRALIMDGRLPPATRLRLRPLAEQLGVSVMPVRDAIRALGNEGLVETSDHGGARVASVSREEIVEIVSVRMWLETHAVMESVGRHDAKSIDKARQALASGAKALKVNGGLAFTQANRHFHEAIEAPATGLSTVLIADLWSRLWQVRRQQSLFVLLPEQMAVAHREHQQIFKAVEARDVESAVAAMERHRQGTLDAWRRAFAPDGSP
jgi:DNA-binding GntR family transcriptional regulator